MNIAQAMRRPILFVSFLFAMMRGMRATASLVGRGSSLGKDIGNPSLCSGRGMISFYSFSGELVITSSMIERGHLHRA
jgi:hypothetical protein